MNKAIIISAAAAASFVLSGCGNKGGDELVVINGESIGVEDLHRHLETKMDFMVSRVDQQTNIGQLSQTPAFQGFLDLVTRRITLQLAKDKGVEPTSDTILRELEFRKKIDQQYANRLMSMGITQQQIKEQIAFDLARENLLTKGMEVTDAEVKKYIADNAKRFIIPEEVQLFYIQADSPDTKKKVESELALGKPFQTVAVTNSDSQTVRDDNGRVNPNQTTYTERLAPELRKHIAKTAENKSTGWIKFGNSEAMFYVDKRIPAKKVKIDEIMLERVKRELLQSKGATAMDLQKQIRDKVIESKFDIKNKTLAALWDRYITSLKRSTIDTSDPNAAGG